MRCNIVIKVPKGFENLRAMEKILPLVMALDRFFQSQGGELLAAQGALQVLFGDKFNRVPWVHMTDATYIQSRTEALECATIHIEVTGGYASRLDVSVAFGQVIHNFVIDKAGMITPTTSEYPTAPVPA